MYFIKIVLISVVLLINKNSSAQPEDHTKDQNEVEKCSSHKKVCGTDGKTYNNICLLQKETDVKLAHEGDCTRKGKKKTAYRPDLILKSKIVNTTEESLQKKLVKHFNPTTGKWEYVVEILPTIVITPTFHHLQMTNDDQGPSFSNVTNVKTKADLKSVGAVNAPTQLDVNNLPSTYFGKTSGGIYPKKKLTIDSPQDPFNENNNNITEIKENVTNNFPRSQVENGVLLPIKNGTTPSFNTEVSHPNRSHPSVFPTQEISEITEEKSPLGAVNALTELDVNTNVSHPNRSHPSVFPTQEISEIIGEKLPVGAVKALTELEVNTNVSHPNRSHPSVFPTRETSKITGKKSPVHRFQTVLNKQKSFNRVFGPIKSEPIPSFNTTISHPNRSHPSVFPTRETSKISGKKSPVHRFPTVLNESKALFVRPNNTDHEINEVFKTKNVSSPYPKTTGNVTYTKRNNSQSNVNNMTNTIPFKLPGDHEEFVDVAPLTGVTAVPVFPSPHIAVPIWNETLAHPKEGYDHKVWNVSQSTGEGSVIATPPRNDSHGPMVNITQPITNITRLKDLSMIVGYDPMRNTSQPIKEAPESGDLASGKLNITRAPKETEEFLPNEGPPIHRIPSSFHPGHSKLSNLAVRVPKLHGRIPPKNIPSFIENPKKNITQTKPNTDTKPESNTKWGTYHIKLPGNVSDNIDLVLNWEVLQLKTNQPNLTINVSEVIGNKNYIWPKDSKYATDTSTYHKFSTGSLNPINEKIQRKVNKNVWHNTNSRHPQFLVNTRKTGDVPINVTKTTEIKTYQLEDEVTLKENRKRGLLHNRKERKLGAYRYINPTFQVISKKFGHSLEKYGSYSLDLPSNIAGNFKLTFKWTLKNKLPKTIRSPIDVREKQVKYDYKWKIGGNNKEEKPIGNEEIQPIRSVKEHKTATPIKHSFGGRRLTGRHSPGRRLHDLAQGLGNVHLDVPKTTTKPQLNTTSASVKTEEIKPSTKLYPGWYYMKMLFNVPGVDGGCSGDNNNCTNRYNYNDTSKSQMDPTDLLAFKNVKSLLPIDHPSFLDKYAIVRAKAHQGKCNEDNAKTK